MAVDFVPQGVYEDIINLLGQWKVMDMKSLKEMCSYDVQYYNLLHKVRKLENHGLVKGILLGKKNKHIFLTNKGLQYTPYDKTYEICDENITHDVIVGKVLKELLRLESFFNGKMFHQIISDKILPDAEIEGQKDGECYRLALEIELTQKSQDRVKGKYRQYARGNVFNYGLFITNKMTLFKAYKKYLEEMKSEIQESIILLYDRKLTEINFDYQSSECFYMGQMTSFKELFGD